MAMQFGKRGSCAGADRAGDQVKQGSVSLAARGKRREKTGKLGRSGQKRRVPSNLVWLMAHGKRVKRVRGAQSMQS